MAGWLEFFPRVGSAQAKVLCSKERLCGLGQALWEEAVYDENGQLVTGSMLDYALPRAEWLPDIEVLSTVTPSPHHPLGLKGIGEAGTIASTVAMYNAVMDALSPLGVETLQMPMTAERVWRGIRQARQQQHHATR